jgi:hypothetical protein
MRASTILHDRLDQSSQGAAYYNHQVWLAYKDHTGGAADFLKKIHTQVNLNFYLYLSMINSNLLNRELPLCGGSKLGVRYELWMKVRINARSYYNA